MARRTVELYCRAADLLELIMLKHSLLCVRDIVSERLMIIFVLSVSRLDIHMKYTDQSKHHLTWLVNMIRLRDMAGGTVTA